jgi:AraC-like DNA-binding protein
MAARSPEQTLTPSVVPALHVVAFAARDRARAAARRAVPRRHGRITVTRLPEDFRRAMRGALVDAAVVDLGAPPSLVDRVLEAASDFPTIAFVGLSPYRTSDAVAIARCATVGFVDVLADGIDDDILRSVVAVHGFTPRFARLLHDPPSALKLATPLQLAAWRAILAHAGRPVCTEAVARTVRVSREHLSRSFRAGGAPTLKRAIDLVRLLAAAELAKSPGLDLPDVARVLGFRSEARLSSAATRAVGARVGSFSALRGTDLIQRYARIRGRG